jgi:hypothetical protein
MLALYATFWLQLESPSIAALTVGIRDLRSPRCRGCEGDLVGNSSAVQDGETQHAPNRS